MQGELATLKADIDQGLADIAAGRVNAFDAERIIAQGKQRLAARSNWPKAPSRIWPTFGAISLRSLRKRPQPDFLASDTPRASGY